MPGVATVQGVGGMAARMREAWALRDARSGISEKRSENREEISDEPAAPQSLADRLRAAAHGIDSEGLAARLTALQQDREAKERETKRDKGMDHGM